MNNTLQNGFRLLEYLAGCSTSKSVKELAETFQLPASHVCRLLKTLLNTGYIQQDSSRRYRVSVRILSLSHTCLMQLDVRNKAHAHIFRLQQEIGGRTYLSVPSGGRALMVDVISPDCGDQLFPSIGRFNAVNYSASGKLCAAFATPSEQELLLKEPMPVRTVKTISTPEALREEFRRIRIQRYATGDGESGDGIFSVAAPVFAPSGTLAAAVGTYRISQNFSGAEKEELRRAVIQCANNISCELLASSIKR